MEVILLERVKSLGNLGDKVQVKAGYARNFLIPTKKAVFATEKNLEHFEQRRAELEKKAEQAKAQAEQRAAKINDARIEIKAMATEEGKLYGSIGVAEVKDALVAKGIEVSKREIVLPEGPIHVLGTYKAEIHLHSDVLAFLEIEIVSTPK